MENTRDKNDGSSDYSGQLFESFFTADEHRTDNIGARGAEYNNTIFASSISDFDSRELCRDSLCSMASKPSSVRSATGPKTIQTPHLEHVLCFQRQILLGGLEDSTLPKSAPPIDKDSPREDQATMGYQYSVAKECSGYGLSDYSSISLQQYPKIFTSTIEFSRFRMSTYAHQILSRSAPNLLAGGTKWRIPIFRRRNSCPISLHRGFSITTCMKPDPLAQDRQSASLNGIWLSPLSTEVFCHQVGTSLPSTRHPKSLETVRFVEAYSDTPDFPSMPGQPLTDFDFVSIDVESAPNGSRFSSRRKRLAKQLRRFKKAVNRVLA